MVGRPRAASTSVACTFMDTSSAPRVVPKTKRPMKNSGTLPASMGRGRKQVKASMVKAVGGREPSLPSATPASGMVMTEAMAMVKMAMPRIAGSMASRAWITGMWTAQMPVPRPATRKA